MILGVLLCVIIGTTIAIVVSVHFYNKQFPPQFYKTVPSQIKSQYNQWTSDGATPIETPVCLEWDETTKGMYYQKCDETNDNQLFSMFYIDKEKTKPHGFGVMKGGRYQCFGPKGVTIEKSECDTNSLYQKFSYDNDTQRLVYLGPNVKSTSSQVMIPQSFQTNNKVIIWDTFNNDPKGNQVFV